MNQYLKHVNKLEFVVTDACTGRCKHCSVGEHKACGARIDPQIAADAVRKIAAEYDVETVMALGGEPLLHAEAVYAIMEAARENKISRRQVITNGYFSKNSDEIRDVTARLFSCGVNDLLLSVDAFHQETIPLDAVRFFLAEAMTCGIPARLSPAWLVRPDDDNPYNRETRRILERLADVCACVGDGNVVFPEGNAKKYLAEYFTGEVAANPYLEDAHDVRCVSFSPSGDVLDGNAYRQDVMEILERYAP